MSESDSFVARLWRERDRPGWRLFAASMGTLAVAMVLALFSAAVAQEGRIKLATGAAFGAGNSRRGPAIPWGDAASQW